MTWLKNSLATVPKRGWWSLPKPKPAAEVAWAARGCRRRRGRSLGSGRLVDGDARFSDGLQAALRVFVETTAEQRADGRGSLGG